MRSWRIVGVGLISFALGTIVQSSSAQRKPAFDPEIFKGKDPKVAAAAMLENALQLAESGSWERIAVGRAWYLGGDKTKGQHIIDEVINSKRAVGSDWFRVGRIYAEAGEWDKAKAAFDRALTMDTNDDTGMIEYGALANINNDREKAEALFEKALRRKPREFWHWVNAGGSYLGVKAQ